MNDKIKRRSYKYIEFVTALKKYARSHGNINKLNEKCRKLCHKYFSEPRPEILFAAEEYASGIRNAFLSEYDLLRYFLICSE